MERGGLGGIQTVWPFPLNCVWEDRHAIPSPTDIILYQPTEAMQMSEEGGVGKTEQRNFSETG